MEFYEIHSLLKYSYFKEQEDWEQTRMLSFIIAKSNGAKNIKLTDLIKFPWEKDIKKEPKFISDEDMKRLRAKAQSLINNKMLKEV